MLKEKKVNSINDGIIIIVLILMGAMYYSSRFMMEGIPHYESEDTYFHLNRLISMENVWQSPVNYNAFEGDGSLANIFYPWLTLYPMWILFRITDNYVLSYKLYYLLLSVITILTAYYSLEKITKDKVSGACFAVMYSFSAYRFADIFRRQALGECLALAFLPLLLYGMYKILFDDYKEWKTISIGMTLIAYSHLLSVLMSTLMLGVMLLLSWAFVDNRKERFVSLIKAASVTTVLSLGAVVPVIHYYYSDIFRPSGSGELASETSYSLKTLITSAIRNETTAHHVGILVIAAFALGCVMLYNQIRRAELETERLTAIIIFMATGFIFLLATSSILPWYFLGEKTVLGNIQFVWRLNAYPTLLIIAAFSWLLPLSIKEQKIQTILLIIIIAGSATLHCIAIFQLHKDEVHRILEEEIRTSLIEYHAPYFDYAPRKAFQYYLENGYTLSDCYIDDRKVESIQEVSKHGTKISFRIHRKKDQNLMDIPVFFNNISETTVNDSSVIPRMSKRGTFLIDYSGGEEDLVVSVENHYDYTVVISWFVSLIAAIFILVNILKRT